MSEYQYYDFRAIDNPLTEAQRQKVSSLSSRAEVTSRTAAFVYNYGDFRGDEYKLMQEYFDMMLYAANWGSRHLMFRLPLSLVDRNVLDQYRNLEQISIKTSKENLIIDIYFNPEDMGDWIDAEGWLDDMLDLREELLRGDYRILNLTWLRAIQEFIVDDYNRDDDDEYFDKISEDGINSVEPPVPPGLGKLSKALNAYADFMEVDEALIAVAAMESKPLDEHTGAGYESFISQLPADEQYNYLHRLSLGEPNLSVIFNKRLKELAYKSQPEVPKILPVKRRKVSELFESAKQWEKKKLAEKERNAKAAKKRRIAKTQQNEAQYWQQVKALIDEKSGAAYETAVGILKDLKELAIDRKETEKFIEEIKSIIKMYPTRTGLTNRLKNLI